MEYEITATLGPTSETESIWRAMISAGATGFRLNTSHLTVDQLLAWLQRIKHFLSSAHSDFPVVLDLQGSKWRLGEFAPFELRKGETVQLVPAERAVAPGILPVPHSDFFAASAGSNGEIVLNDAKSRLRAEKMEGEKLVATVVRGGQISPRKGITFAASEYRKESLSDKDRLLVEQTSGETGVRYAISYVRDEEEMAVYRRLLGKTAYLIAKVERDPAISRAEEIARSADELWICRGDLGAELGMKRMAESVQRFSTLLPRLTVPVLLAGQVLEHMTEKPSATRSEISYLYESLLKGYDGFVLSDETAIGRHPVEACRVAALFKE